MSKTSYEMKTSGSGRPRGKYAKKGRRGGNGDSMRVGYLPAGLSFGDAGMVCSTMPVFGMTHRTTITYVANFISITSGAGTLGGYVFSANGCFDPDITGTGGQPMGFDQMMIYYNHYAVLNSRCRVCYKATTAANPAVGLAVSGSSTPLTSVEQLLEAGKVSWKWLMGTGVNGNSTCLSARVSTALFQGVKNVQDDPDLRGDSASNPAEQSYYLLYVWNPIDSTVASASVSVRIEYDVLFTEARTPSLS